MTLMYALGITPLIHILNGDYATANALLDELASLVGEKKALHWKGQSMAVRGWLFCLGVSDLGASIDPLKFNIDKSCLRVFLAEGYEGVSKAG